MKIKFILIGFLLSIILSTQIYAFVYSETYPYPNSTQCKFINNEWVGCVTDPWNFYRRECTSYAAHMINQDGIAMQNGMRGPNGAEGLFGHAGNWDDNASDIGYTVNSTPKVGSIAVWDPGACTGCAVGHVAYVRKVNTNGTVFISEYNWNYGDGNYNERDGLSASHYIHFNDGMSCGGSNVTIADKTINTGTTCSASNSITINPLTTVNSSGGDVKFKIQ